MVNIIFLNVNCILKEPIKAGSFSDVVFCEESVKNLKKVFDTVSFCKLVLCVPLNHLNASISTQNSESSLKKVLCEKLENDLAIIGEIDTSFNELQKKISEWLNFYKQLGIGDFVIVDEETNKYNEIFPNNYVGIELNNDNKTLLTENKAQTIIWLLTKSGRDKSMDENTWFIADTHFLHDNIIKYCNRPFKNADEMTEVLVSNWNKTVKPTDTVWHLGDFCFGKNKLENTKNILSRLNGKINIVLGNHDRQGNENIKHYYEIGFNRVYDKPVLINNFFILSHEPVQWIRDGYPYFNIFGHVHDMEIYKTHTKNTCCVCVERWNYTPVNWKTIERIITENNEQ